MKSLILLLTLLISSNLLASDAEWLFADSRYKLIELNELYFDYRNYSMLNDKARNPLIYPIYPKEAVNVGISLDMIGVVYWNSEIQSLTSDSKYEAIGLDTRLGVRITSGLEIGFWHKSEHLLDRVDTRMKYPSQDAIQLKLFLYQSNKHGSIF